MTILERARNDRLPLLAMTALVTEYFYKIDSRIYAIKTKFICFKEIILLREF